MVRVWFNCIAKRGAKWAHHTTLPVSCQPVYSRVCLPATHCRLNFTVLGVVFPTGIVCEWGPVVCVAPGKFRQEEEEVWLGAVFVVV